MVLVIRPVVLLPCAVLVMMIGLLLVFLALRDEVRVVGCRRHPLLQRILLLSLIRLPVVGL